MPHVTGAFSYLVAPGLRKVFFMTLKEKPSVHERIFNIISSRRKYEDDLEMAGLGIAPQKLEGESVAYQDITQGTTRRYTQKTYGLGFRVTMEMMEYDLYGPMKKSAAALAKSHRAAVEQVAANVFNNGTDSTLEPGFKSGEALFANTHTAIGGTTQDNLIEADLGLASYEAARLLLDKLVDEKGLPIDQSPAKLVCAMDQQYVALQLIRSSKVPFSGNNEPNPFYNEVEVIPWKYLTDTDFWALLSDEHDLNLFRTIPYRFQSGDDFDSGDAKFKGVQAFAVGHGDYRGAVGSYGAA